MTADVCAFFAIVVLDSHGRLTSIPTTRAMSMSSEFIGVIRCCPVPPCEQFLSATSASCATPAARSTITSLFLWCSVLIALRFLLGSGVPQTPHSPILPFNSHVPFRAQKRICAFNRSAIAWTKSRRLPPKSATCKAGPESPIRFRSFYAAHFFRFD